MMEGAVNLIGLLCAMLIFAYGCYAIWDTNTVVRQATPAKYQEYKPQAEASPGYAELKAQNNDVAGWVTVYGTGVDYPVLRTDNNDKYLRTDPLGNYSLSGSIFIDYKNQADFSDFNTVIYGHHMAYHVMFGDIGNFINEDYFNSHPYGNLYYAGKDHGIAFFAFLAVDVYQTGVYRIAVSETDRESYLEELRQTSLYTRPEIGVSPDDRIVLLSTCSQDITNGRHILAGKVTDETYPDTFRSDTAKTITLEAVTEANRDMLSTWVLVFLAAVLCIAWAVLKGREKQKSDRR